MINTQKKLHEELTYVPDVMHFFGLPQPIKTEIITSGFVNHNILVTTEKQNYVIKFLNRIRTETIENDIAIQKQLHAAGVGSIVYLQNKKDAYLYRKDMIAALLSKYIPGQNPQEYIAHTATALGEALGIFHTVVTELPHHHVAWLNPEVTSIPLKDESEPLVKQARIFLKKGAQIFEHNLPKGIIHSDLHADNVLVLPEHPSHAYALLDFEEAERNIFLVDIARAILTVCRDKTDNALDPHLVASYLQAYNTKRQLTAEEKHLLPLALSYAAGAVMLWFLRYAYPNYAQQYQNRFLSYKHTPIF